MIRKFCLFLLLWSPLLAKAQAPWSSLLSPVGTCSYGSTNVIAGCAIDWTVAGIPGGIPVGTQASAVSSTGSDQTTALNSALSSCGGTSSAEKYVWFNAGTYKTSNVLTVPSYCYINGPGADQVIIQNTSTAGNGIVALGSGSPSTSNDTAITSGLSAGSTSIVVASVAHISVGSLLSITELNSANMNVNSNGSEGFCNFCDNYGGYRSSGQTVLVTAASGTTLTISPGLYWTYGSTLPNWSASKKFNPGQSITNGGHIYWETQSNNSGTPLPSPFTCTSGASTPAFSTSGGSVTDGSGSSACVWLDKGTGTTTSPVATPFTPSIEAGIENVQLYTVNAGTSTLVGPSVSIKGCQYCFVHGIEVNYTDADFIYAFFMYGGEISENYFSNAIVHGPGVYDSTIQLSTGTSQVLVQNNIIERPHVGVLAEHQTSGNVFGYNYFIGGFDTGSPEFVIGEFDFHGAHPEFNLLEGNVGIGVYEDSVWGTSSNTTIFRNWSKGSHQINYPIANGRNTVTGNGTNAPCNSITSGEICHSFQASRAMQVSYLSQGTNLIGNVVGSVDQQSNIGYSGGVTSYTSGTGQTDAVKAPATRTYDDVVYGYSFDYGESQDGDSGTIWTLDGTLAQSTSLLHANYGNATSAIVYSGSLTHTLPASFYLSGKPNWWSSDIPFPSIGPDVTGQTGPGGHVSLLNAIPAQKCYISVMGGTAGGAGSPLTFNAATCFPTSGASITIPTTAGTPGLLQ